MKKTLTSIILIVLVLLAPMVFGSHQADQNEETVFIEYATTTWCPQCPDASNALYELHQSGQYPFIYVTLVSDVNMNAQQRSSDFDTVAIPTIYLNGGNTLFVGNSESYDSLKDTYTDLIMEQIQKQDQKSISVETTAQWLGNAQIAINVTVTNQGTIPYFGRIRTYVNEKNSRWFDEQNNSYHYSLLDFAFNQRITLSKKESKTFSTRWDGNENHNGLTFEDITPDNIVISSSVFHWLPQPRLGYIGFPFIQFFFAHNTDAADMKDLNR